MTNLELARQQGNQAASLIVDSLASSELYDAIKQQGNQAMPLIVDALAGGGSDIDFETMQLQIVADFDTPELHIIENPSAMFAGLDFRVHLQSHYDSYGCGLIGRDDVVLLYKEQSAAIWESATMTSTSDGYFAEVETGWGHKTTEYKVQINGVSSDVAEYYEFDALPMTPSFVDIINDQGTYKARLRFGANYPDMNTVETIEYSFDNENWMDAMHDVTSGYELANVTNNNAETLYFRAKLVSDSLVTSATVTAEIQQQSPSENNN